MRRNAFGALVIALALTALYARPALAQAKTEVRAVVPGAKPVTVEHIKIHGAASEGNLEGDGIVNKFEIYHGTHTSAVADRFQNHVMPFFSQNLCAGRNCR